MNDVGPKTRATHTFAAIFHNATSFTAHDNNDISIMVYILGIKRLHYWLSIGHIGDNDTKAGREHRLLISIDKSSRRVADRHQDSIVPRYRPRLIHESRCRSRIALSRSLTCMFARFMGETCCGAFEGPRYIFSSCRFSPRFNSCSKARSSRRNDSLSGTTLLDRLYVQIFLQAYIHETWIVSATVGSGRACQERTAEVTPEGGP